jgi:phage FluMu protein Com
VGVPEKIKTGLAHAGWGAPHCTGYIGAITRGDTVELECEECGILSWTISAAEFEQTLTRMKSTRLPTLPHSEFGDLDCCGCLAGHLRGDIAEIIFNECGALIRTVPTTALERVLAEMELTLNFCSEECPHCRSVNLISGFSQMLAYTYKNCGELVRLSDDPSVERLFGPADEE